MEASVSRRDAQHFRSPRSSLGDLDAEVAGRLIAAAADVALILDGEGVIQDVAFGNEELSREGYGTWLGRPWVETVTVESRPKIEELLDGAASAEPPRWRQVNHPSAHGADVPVRYSTIQVTESGRVVAVGRDLRSMAALQQRLVDAQQAMEREYARLREAEARYRLMFQIASEAVLIVDALTQRIVEANPAATALLEGAGRQITDHGLSELFHAGDAALINSTIAQARALGRTGEVQARLANGERPISVAGSFFRQDNNAYILVRMTAAVDGAAEGTGPRARVPSVMESVPDGFVVTDPDGSILLANAAFLELAQLASEEQARGQSLDRWLGRPGLDLSVMSANLRQHGTVRLFGTTLRGEHGAAVQVEISAVSVPDPAQPCFGFVIRNVARRLPAETRPVRELPRSMDQLTDLVGRVPLKDLVRETTDVIERLCIEAALELTGDNRASAAEVLGLSRQSLYVKLRRYGLGDLESEAEI
ncbi:MAG TPA: transcriptional regulator PpsR [Beijerinckiaceae bacterium]|jgi:transcriptional regulator PpsR